MPTALRKLLCFCAVFAGLMVSVFAEAPSPPERDLSEPIRVGVTDSFFPYSFLDSDQVRKGFSVDLMEAVAKVMDLRLQRVPVINSAMGDALRSGQIDMIQNWSETPARLSFTRYSTPYLRCETVILVHKDNADIRTIEDLAGKRVGVGNKGNVGDRALDEHAASAIRVYRESSADFLALLDQGGCDAAVMSRLTAASLIQRDKLRNLRILDAKLPGYDVRYCFAVRKGDDLLLARLNEGLAILHRTGEFDQIYTRWFGHQEGTRITPFQLVCAIAMVLAIATLLAGIAFLRQRRLSARIAGQAAELDRQRALLAALHDNHPLATFVLDLPIDGSPVLVSVNAQGAQLSGLAPLGSAGKSFAELQLEGDTQAFFDAVLVRWHAHDAVLHWELQLPASKRWLECFLVPLGSGLTATKRLCVLACDISSRRAMDHEIALSRRQRALGELVGGVAHEFNNLLTPILAAATEIAETYPDDAQLQEDLRTIRDATQRGADLTRRLLTFGRRGDKEAVPVLLSEAVASSLELLRHTIDRRISLRCEAAPVLPPLLFNRTDLHQVIFNLLINARDTLNEKLARPGRNEPEWSPSITIALSELPASAIPLRVPTKGRRHLGWQVLTIADNGMGIAPEIIDRIYEPFFTTKEVGTGTGLGLATTWHILNEAGGTIEIDSRVGEQTVFKVCFPTWEIAVQHHRRHAPHRAHDDDRHGPNQATATANNNHAANGTHPAAATNKQAAPERSLRVMLTDDDDSVARVIGRIIERVGHACVRYRDGQEAWEAVNTPGAEPFDVMILDMNMPRMHGLDLASRLREAKVPGRIVIMSGRITDENLGEIKRLGITDVITKPVSLETLRSVLS